MRTFVFAEETFRRAADELRDMMNGRGQALSPEELAAAKKLIARAQETVAELADYLGSEADVLVDDDLEHVFEDLQTNLT